MKLEWDEAKRRATLRERGLDFADFGSVDWDEAQTGKDTRRNYDEVRFITIVPLGGRLVVVCWTRREDRVRVISMRKANERERRKHERNRTLYG
ncbi:BrnT family toxin [Jannaschia sp. LMIT008]|uniref:BrnT family toxin n=1 Tax=Jannaschia maritima TaxID=3032585 RepID=UPI0028113C79|nr:BrnT family toxin [Jannaschia sp. LMIT008]